MSPKAFLYRTALAALPALLALAESRPALGAPCCGGSSVAPTLLTGDDRAQLSISLAQSQVVGDAPPTGLPVFRADGDTEQAQTFRLEGALLLSDRWQAGASVPFVRRSRDTPATSSAASGWGDIGLSAAYEALPEWEYSAWKPRGFLFAEAILPAGGSVYQSAGDDPWQLSARGRGFYALGAGAVLLKSWGDWDASFSAELHRAFPRTFTTASGDLRLVPGWGSTLGLSGGYSLRVLPIRLGFAISPTYESGISASGAIDSDSDHQLVWSSIASLAWSFGHDSTLSAIYTDQTLVGPASNVALSRALAVLFQQRWER